MLEQDAGREAHRTFAAETVFQRSMIRTRVRGSSGHSYGSATLWFVWRSSRWSRTLGLLSLIVIIRVARAKREDVSLIPRPRPDRIPRGAFPSVRIVPSEKAAFGPPFSWHNPE